MASFPFTTLPLELQAWLLETLDTSTLSLACRVSKDVSAQAVPLLRRHIDLKELKEEHGNYSSLQKFFCTCYVLKQSQSDRWRILAAYVQVLRLGKVPSPFYYSEIMNTLIEDGILRLR